MTREEIQDYSLRITQGNKTALVVTTYDIILKYLADAQEAYKNGNTEQFVFGVKKANEFLAELMRALDLQYALGLQLLQLYRYIQKMLVKAIFSKMPDSLQGLEDMLISLREAFAEVAKQDKSPSFAGKQVYAGLTYGKSSLNETYEQNPGFRV
ncbi:MAG: flagellar protein FliS [Lachnospiraceae bacterium]|nr:flagellar protein FliS [Lachnospiraceae bacterium]